MGYNQFSQAVQPVDLYKPIDDNVLAMGQKSIYDRAEKLGEKVSVAGQNIFGINTYGKDAEVLNELQTTFNQQIEQLAKEGLDKPDVQSRINTLISQYSSNPDLINIHQRKAQYDQFAKQLQDYQEKGKFVPPWKMKPLQDAENYYSGDKYLTNKRFTGSIEAGFDWDKHKESVAKAVPELELLKKGITNDVYKGKAYNNLYSGFLNSVYTQPGAMEDLQGQFEHYYGDQDFATADKQLAASQYADLKAIYDNTENPIQKEQIAKDLQYWKDLHDNVNPNTSKTQAFEHYVKSVAQDFANSATNFALKESKLSDAETLRRQHNNRINEIKAQQEANLSKLREAQRIKASASNISDSLQRKLIEKGVESGYTSELLNEDGSFKSASDLVKMGLNDKAIDTKLKVGDKEYDKSEIVANINAGNKDFIKDFINAYLPEGAEEVKIEGNNILYDTEGYIGNPFGFDKKITKSELLKLIESDSKIDVGI